MRVVALTLLAGLLAGCELFANVPTGSLATSGDDIGPGDDAGTDGDAGDPICREDSECDTLACLPDGSCAESSRILYAAPAGTGTDCSLVARCSLDTAVSLLAAGRDVIAMATGTYEETIRIDPLADMILLGGDSTIHSSAAAQLILINNSTPVAMTLYRVSIEAEAGIGVDCGMGKLTMIRSASSRALAGVISGTCETVIDRATIHHNTSYGLLINNSLSHVTNTFVVDNGPGDSGVIIFNLDATSTFEHSTIANNMLSGQGTSAIRCTNSPAYVMSSNIVTGTINPACTFTHSIVDPTYAGGSDNLRSDPQFMLIGTDYHIAPTSPAAGLADPASLLDHDFDNLPRPKPAGSISDSGADEI